MERHYDRAAEDIGNIVGLEHVNLLVPDQGLATLFYITGLGLTRDPYLVTGVTNMWVNVGRSQFHLPVGEAQKLRGRVGLVMPDLGALLRRLEAVAEPLRETAFGFVAADHRVDVTCPWGNQIRCHGPEGQYGRVTVGMAYVELNVAVDAAAGIARFYQDVLLAQARVDDSGDTRAARIAVGAGQELVFRETSTQQPSYDGHHIQIYVANFSRPHANLLERGLITEESNQHQYRFTDIADPVGGEVLTRLEHEVRSMTHPLYGRRLVNRNPEQTNTSFAQGHEDWPPVAPVAS